MLFSISHMFCRMLRKYDEKHSRYVDFFAETAQAK